MLHVLHCWGRRICSMCMKKHHSSLVLYIRFWSQCMQSCIWRPVPTCRSLLHFGKNAGTTWCVAMRTVQSTIAVSVFRVLFLQAPENAGTALVLHACFWFCIIFTCILCCMCLFLPCYDFCIILACIMCCTCHEFFIKKALYIALMTIIGNLRLA